MKTRLVVFIASLQMSAYAGHPGITGTHYAGHPGTVPSSDVQKSTRSKQSTETRLANLIADMHGPLPSPASPSDAQSQQSSLQTCCKKLCGFLGILNTAYMKHKQ